MVILGLARVFFSLESILVFLGVKNYFNHFIVIIIIIVPKNVYESSIGMLLYEPHVQAQSISPCMVKSPGPKAKSGPISGRELVPSRGPVPTHGLYQMGTIMRWGKLLTKHHLMTIASFKTVTLVINSGPYLIRNIS